MIRPLRQRHRVMVCTLGVILPIAFLAGITARRPVPVVASLPSALTGEGPRVVSLVWERDDLWTQKLIRTRLVSEKANGFSVELCAREDIVRPDLLVYWVLGEGKLDRKLPEDAVLLGAFVRAMVLPLPPETSKQNGRLVLYSLADHEVVAVSKAFKAGKN